MAAPINAIRENKNVIDKHPVFRRDALKLKDYVYKEVRITMQDGRELIGWVYTIDPVSESFAIIKFASDAIPKEADGSELTLILGHAVKEIRVTNNDVASHRSRLDFLFSAGTGMFSKEEMESRKVRLKEWLEKNRIPVEFLGQDDSVLNVADAATIVPPYRVNNCQSTNVIILGRIQALIKSMPDS
ncbi:PREDICTED: gem-associated protein 6-like [Priapulus caudatus]|uniref:Gem-associated protein 6-like n=1 Tax=Priapulus caudatus TaxID=37621 RepID=A0ABM1DTT8_PRICU|nr:PREDICTED: gem-associated protein 6-like [Priapulus caudatus]